MNYKENLINIKNLLKKSENYNTSEFLLLLIKLFKLPLDSNNLNNYTIENIDLNNLIVRIKDNKANINYLAKYTNNKYIEIYQNNQNYSKYLLYIIDRNLPLEEILSFYNDNKKIDFIKDYPFVIGENINSKHKLSIRYSENNQLNKLYPLLTKIYGIEEGETLEQSYTYDKENFLRKNNSQNEYSYLSDNNLIYGHIKHTTNNNHLFWSACVENADMPIKDYIPDHINLTKFTQLDKAKSTFIFRETNDLAIRHILNIYKYFDKIHIKYNIVKYEKNKEKTLYKRKKDIISLSPNNITISEINNIINVLKNEFKYNSFMINVISELTTFKNKIQEKNGLYKKEEKEIVTPKKFFDMKEEDLIKEITLHKEQYFNLLEQDYQNIINSNNLNSYKR